MPPFAAPGLPPFAVPAPPVPGQRADQPAPPEPYQPEPYQPEPYQPGPYPLAYATGEPPPPAFVRPAEFPEPEPGQLAVTVRQVEGARRHLQAALLTLR